MTIEELLSFPTKTIEEMTDAQLEAHLRKYFPRTRPGAKIETALAAVVDRKLKPISENNPALAMERRLEAEFIARQAAAKKTISVTGIKIK